MRDKPETLAEALLRAAHHNARAAFGMRDSSDFHSQLQTALQAGSAIEYLLKFLLVSESPLLVAEVRPSTVKFAIQSRVALSRNAFGPHLSDVKSCSMEDAFVMVQEILGLRLLRQTELQSVIKARNAAIHLAIFPEHEEQEDNLCTMISAFDYAARKQPSVAFASSEHEEMTAYVERRMQVRFQSAQAKVHPPGTESWKPSASDEGVGEKFIARQREFLDSQAEYVFGAADEWQSNGEFPTTRHFMCLRCGRKGIALCWAEGISFDEFFRTRGSDRGGG